MSDNNSLSRAEVEVVARRTVEACQEKFRTDFLYALKPLMYEVAEKVSARNSREMGQILERVLNLNYNDSESIRELQQDLFWMRQSRNSAEQGKADFRNHLIRALVWFPISILTGFLMGWLGLRAG
jgi:hypothetical protein